MKKLLLLCLFILLMGSSLLTRAACTISPGSATISLGTVSSFQVNTTPDSSSSTFTVNCGAGLLVLLSTDYINVQLTSATFSASNRANLGLGTDLIPLRLCTDSACGSELLIGGAGTTFNRAQLINLAGLPGGYTFPIPLYLSTVPGAVVAAGNYSVLMNVAFNYSICTSIGVLGTCLLANKFSGTFNVPITVNMTVTNDCTTITAPAISFGSAPLVSSFTKVSQSINVICTKGSTYTVGISNGLHAVGNQRNMANGSTLLAYQIYKGDAALYWGPTTTDRVASTSASAISTDGLTRTFNYNALILTTQNTPVQGSYSDTVTVDLSF